MALKNGDDSMELVVLTEEQLKKVQKLELEALLEIDRLCRKYNIDYTLVGGSLLGAIRHKGFIPWDDDIDIALHREDLNRLEKICEKELDKKFFYQSHATDKNYYRLYSKVRVNDTIFKETVHEGYDIHNGVYIDIFPIDKVPKCRILREIQILKYCFYEHILSAKYLNIKLRKGKRKIIAIILRSIFAPLSLEYLYNKSNKTASKYDNYRGKVKALIFSGAFLRKECFEKEIYENFMNVQFEEKSVRAICDWERYLKELYGDYMQLPPVEKRVSHHYIDEIKV